MSADINQILSVELLWLALPFLVVGVGVWAYFRIKRRQRRALERSKRPIPAYGGIGEASESPAVLQAFVCKVLGHKRSKRQARRDSETALWRSVCKRCGCRLQKSDDSAWRPEV